MEYVVSTLRIFFCQYQNFIGIVSMTLFATISSSRCHPLIHMFPNTPAFQACVSRSPLNSWLIMTEKNIYYTVLYFLCLLKCTSFWNLIGIGSTFNFRKYASTMFLVTAVRYYRSSLKFSQIWHRLHFLFCQSQVRIACILLLKTCRIR